jgi:hypothetical protein
MVSFIDQHRDAYGLEPGGLQDYAELHRMPPSEFDQPMDYDASCDLWLMRHGPALRSPDAVGGLDFIEEMNMGGSSEYSLPIRLMGRQRITNTMVDLRSRIDTPSLDLDPWLWSMT